VEGHRIGPGRRQSEFTIKNRGRDIQSQAPCRIREANRNRSEAVREVAQERPRTDRGTFEPGAVSPDTGLGKNYNRQCDTVALAAQVSTATAASAHMLAFRGTPWKGRESFPPCPFSIRTIKQTYLQLTLVDLR
jgi:hypothetical protein